MADSKFHDHPAESPDVPAEPEVASEAPQELVYRRAPKITPFLVTGAVLGVVVAFFWVPIAGATQEFSLAQTVSFFSAIFAVAGLAIGAVWWMIVDRRSKRNMSTVYARPTQDPDATDVALTEDDYAEWSEFQRNERLDQARREQFAQAKADAKAKKHSKRK